MVVFRVANSDRIVNRETQSRQALRAGPTPLLTPCGSTINRPRLKSSDERQFQFSNNGQNLRSRCRIEFHDALANLEFQTSPPEFFEEYRRRWIAEQSRMAVRKIENRSIFRDHRVNKPEVPGNLFQLGQDAAGYDHNGDPAGAQHRAMAALTSGSSTPSRAIVPS